MILYVGESKRVLYRITHDHFAGNIEGSALRRHVARNFGFEIIKQKRSSGSTRYRIGSENPRESEKRISQYVRTCEWKFVFCNSPSEARDFQWFVIKKQMPVFNVTRLPWDTSTQIRYEDLFSLLMDSLWLYGSSFRYIV